MVQVPRLYGRKNLGVNNDLIWLCASAVVQMKLGGDISTFLMKLLSYSAEFYVKEVYFARLNGADINMPEWQFSKAIRSAKIRYTDYTVMRLIHFLGKLGNWRRVLQVIEWLQRQDRYKSNKLRYIFTDYSKSELWIYYIGSLFDFTYRSPESLS